MKELEHVGSFRDLVVYRKVRVVAKEIFNLSKSFPAEETYSLTSQVRRSSRSIGAQIAEAWAKRRYEKHFISKLTDADAEHQETIHWIDTALECNYLGKAEAAKLISDLSEVGRMLNSMMRKAACFVVAIPGMYVRIPPSTLPATPVTARRMAEP